MHSALTHWFCSLVFFLLFSPSATFWLGKGWGCGGVGVCVCCLISSPLIQEVLWSASSGDLCWRSGTLIFFAPFLSFLPSSCLVSPYSITIICCHSYFLFRTSSSPSLPLVHPIRLLLLPHTVPLSLSLHCLASFSMCLPIFYLLSFQKIMWRGVMIVCQYGTAWPNGYWTAFKRSQL